MLSKTLKMYNKKKAQVAGQVLMYVLAIIVFAMTLLYGYKAIKSFTDQSTEISYLQLENDIKGDIEKVEGDSKGTVKKKVLNTMRPCAQQCNYPERNVDITV